MQSAECLKVITMSKGKLSDRFFVYLNVIACIPVIMFGAMLAIEVTNSYRLVDGWYDILSFGYIIVLPCGLVALVNGILAAYANRNTISNIAFVLFFVNAGVALLWPAC